jgi:carbon-monoxide dehydrogenase medium subunit
MLVVPDLAFHRPRDLAAVGALLAELGPDAHILAGGTDLVVQMRDGRAAPRHLVDIGGVDSLAEVTVGDDGLRIGANARVSEVVEHLRAWPGYTALVEAARCVGSIQIQNRATVVGNVCNASPAADTVPALLVHRAEVEILGPDPRTASLETFLLGPGRTALAPSEWVAALHMPPCHASEGSAYVKLGRARGVDLAIVGVACRIDADGARLAFASVGPTAVLIDLPGDPVAALPDAAREAIDATIRPIDDVRASADYRSAMALTLAHEAWTIAHGRFRGSLT